MKELNPVERRALKARAHSLHPVVSIAAKGLAPSVLAEIDTCLKSHELIKVRVFGAERNDREALMAAVCEQLDAAPVQHIGNILILYREKPVEETLAAAPAPAAKSAPRKPGRKTPEMPISKIKSAKTGQRRKIEYGQLRNTRKIVKKRPPGIR